MKYFLFLTIFTGIWGCNHYYDGPKSDHFDGKKFFHPFGEDGKSFFTFLKWRLSASKGPWPETQITNPPLDFNPVVDPNKIHATFINHSTVYVRYQNISILTDPQFSDRSSPVSWAGPKRIHPPALEIDMLPKVDIVIVSHNHYDHFDLPSLAKIKSKFDPIFLIPLGDAYLMQSIGVEKFVEMDWWQTHVDDASKLKIHFVPVRHWSARTVFDRNRSLWGGYFVEVGEKKIFFAGDTGYCDVFKTLEQKFGPPDLALLPIGAFQPRWFMRPAHMDPHESLQAHLDLKSRNTMGIHFGTFQLADDGFEEPTKLLQQAMTEASQKSSNTNLNFTAPKVGQTFSL